MCLLTDPNFIFSCSVIGKPKVENLCVVINVYYTILFRNDLDIQ